MVPAKLTLLLLTTLLYKNLHVNGQSRISLEEESDIIRDLSENIDPDIVDREDKSELEEYTTTEVAIDTTVATFNDDVATTVIPEETTTEVVDNNVVSATVEDIYNGGVKAETTTTPPPTTKIIAVQGMSPVLVELDGEPEGNQRNPKVTDPIPQPKLPGFETTASPDDARATLKSWLEDSGYRAPAVLMVPLRPHALNRARAVWEDVVRTGLNVSEIIFVGYDSKGINWKSRMTLHSTKSKNGTSAVLETIERLIIKYQTVTTEDKDGTMRALAAASKVVPYDGAVFVVTDRGAGDLDRLPLAIRGLIRKRLKVYAVWTNPANTTDTEEALETLRNVSRHTEGDVVTYTPEGMDTAPYNMDVDLPLIWDPQTRNARVKSIVEDEKFQTLLVRKGGGDMSLGIPVEYGVTALKVFIEGEVEHAVLYPPNDAPQVDLYNRTSVEAFSPASTIDENMSPSPVILVFPGADPDLDALKVLPMTPIDTSSTMAGMWHLSVRCDSCDYRLNVCARAQLRFHATPIATDKLRIRVTGPVASVRESALVDEYGTELAKLSFRYQPVAGDDPEAAANSPMAELEEDVPLPDVAKTDRVYVEILGRDIRGEPFVRLSEPINQPEVRMGRSAEIDSFDDLERVEETNSKANLRLFNNDSNVLPYNRVTSQVVNQQGTILTAVEIGLSTRLYGTPGDNLQLHFEVTNHREQSVRFSFLARGELNFLRDISPSSQTVLSGQTVNVIVYVGITNTAQPGARDLITFTATGIDQVSISAYVYVVNAIDTNDVWAPELRHTFQGMCIGKLGDDCAQHTWSTTITARDAGTGLLRLTSTPIGLVYDSNFVSGIREEIRATYRATCCAPRLSVTAVDANGNVNSYVIDISGYLNGASVAAIVLGVFLFIAVIALIIFLVYWCVRRRKESRELPYSTSTRN